MTKDQGPILYEEVELHTNPTFELVAEKISQSPLEWDILARKVQRHPHYTKRRLSVAAIRSLFSELHCQHTLNTIADQIPQLDPQPIYGDVVSNGLRFLHNRLGQLLVHDVETDTSWCELDAVATVDHLPVVLEVKLSGDARSDQYTNAVSERRIQIIGRAVHAYFGTHAFGYALITYPEIAASTAFKMGTLRYHGGKIIPFPYREEEYTREIAKICRA